jgi:hypothetical protein
MGWWDTSSTKEYKIPKVPHKKNVDKFFNSQSTEHKKFVPEGKTVNAEF